MEEPLHCPRAAFSFPFEERRRHKQDGPVCCPPRAPAPPLPSPGATAWLGRPGLCSALPCSAQGPGGGALTNAWCPLLSLQASLGPRSGHLPLPAAHDHRGGHCISGETPAPFVTRQVCPQLCSAMCPLQLRAEKMGQPGARISFQSGRLSGEPSTSTSRPGLLFLVHMPCPPRAACYLYLGAVRPCAHGGASEVSHSAPGSVQAPAPRVSGGLAPSS